MALAVRSRKMANIDDIFERTGSDNAGLSVVAFNEGLADRYMSTFEGSTRLSKANEERRKKILKENRRKVDVAYANYQKKNFFSAAKRLRDLLIISFAILFVAALFGALVYNEAQIASINFANSKKERQINKMRQETSQMKETLAMASDLESIRTQAGVRLGMVMPNSNQIVNVVVPKRDHLTSNLSYNSNGVTEEMLSEAKRDLADYYADKDA